MKLNAVLKTLLAVAALGGLATAAYLTTTIPIDVFPDLDRPRVVILTECPGLSPEEVEALVTQPVEAALLGASGVEAVRSQSSQGMMVVYVEFDWKSDVRAARQVVMERLAAVPMPPGVRPQMTPPASIMGQILHVGLLWKPGAPGRRGKTALENRLDLRTVADWVVRPRLLKLPGIAEVIVMGGDRKEYQVLVDPDRLVEFGVSLQQVEAAVRESNLNASGGFLEEGQGERPVRMIGRLGPLPRDVVDGLLKVPVRADGPRPVLLRHVARVEEGAAPKRGDASIDGEPGVVITVVKQPHADTRRLTDEVKAALRDAARSLPAGVVVNTGLFQLKAFIDRGVYYVEEAILIGAVLVVIVLFVFLMNVQTTVITLTAIPLSLVVTAMVFRLIGALTGTELSINVMTLGGIAVAMGELVDDAIVDVENIFRRLKENDALPVPRPALLVVYQASKEVRSAIVFGTAVVILAFAPLFALSGVEGRLFAPLGVAYVVSILASLVVSLTVTPVLSYYLLPRSGAAHGHADGLLLRWLKWGGLPDPPQHAAGRRAALADVGAGRPERLAVVAAGGRLPAEVRRGQRADQRHPARRLVTKGVERGVGHHRREAEDDAADGRQPRRPGTALRPPHRPGGVGRARRAGQPGRVHPDDEPGRAGAPRRVPPAGAGGPAGRGAGRRDRGRAAAVAPDQPHALRRQRTGGGEGLRRRPGHAARPGRPGPRRAGGGAGRHAADHRPARLPSGRCASTCPAGGARSG